MSFKNGNSGPVAEPQKQMFLGSSDQVPIDAAGVLHFHESNLPPELRAATNLLTPDSGGLRTVGFSGKPIIATQPIKGTHLVAALPDRIDPRRHPEISSYGRLLRKEEAGIGSLAVASESTQKGQETEVGLPRWIREFPPIRKAGEQERSVGDLSRIELFNLATYTANGEGPNGVRVADFDPNDDAPEGAPSLHIETSLLAADATADERWAKVFIGDTNQGNGYFMSKTKADVPEVREMREGTIGSMAADESVSALLDGLIFDYEQTSGAMVYR